MAVDFICFLFGVFHRRPAVFLLLFRHSFLSHLGALAGEALAGRESLSSLARHDGLRVGKWGFGEKSGEGGCFSFSICDSLKKPPQPKKERKTFQRHTEKRSAADLCGFTRAVRFYRVERLQTIIEVEYRGSGKGKRKRRENEAGAREPFPTLFCRDGETHAAGGGGAAAAAATARETVPETRPRALSPPPRFASRATI